MAEVKLTVQIAGDGHTGEKAHKQARTDISGAWDLLSWLRQQYDSRVLLANPLRAKAITDMDTLLFKQITLKASGLSARFFDNRTASLLAQLPAKVVSASGRGVARNYLAMGSGFYESSLLGKTPSVPLQVVRGLRGDVVESDTGRRARLQRTCCGRTSD